MPREGRAAAFRPEFALPGTVGKLCLRARRSQPRQKCLIFESRFYIAWPTLLDFRCEMGCLQGEGRASRLPSKPADAKFFGMVGLWSVWWGGGRTAARIGDRDPRRSCARSPARLLRRNGSATGFLTVQSPMRIGGLARGPIENGPSCKRPGHARGVRIISRGDWMRGKTEGSTSPD